VIVKEGYNLIDAHAPPVSVSWLAL